jgi:hypothetical protein
MMCGGCWEGSELRAASPSTISSDALVMECSIESIRSIRLTTWSLGRAVDIELATE